MVAGEALHPMTRRRGGTVRFVLASWRGITRQDLITWILLAMVIGLTQGVAGVLISRGVAWWRQFASSFIDAALPILLLFLCLAVVRNIRPRRVPEWVPYACAAVAAVLLSEAAAWLVVAPVIAWFEDATLWPGLTMDMLPGKWLNLPPIVLMCFLASFGYKYALDARRRADALRAVQLDGARLGRQSYESRLQAMQARVEPEFLFDTLGAAEQLYEADPVQAERMLDDLIVYLRGVLPSLDESHSTLSVELEIARAWLDIMKARAGGRLTWSIDKGADTGACRLPPMVLLPLVEHAVRYAATQPPSVQVLGIATTRDGLRLRVTIIDSAGAFAESAVTADIAQVRARLHALYGAAATLSFVPAAHEAAQAIVDLPYERDS